MPPPPSPSPPPPTPRSPPPAPPPLPGDVDPTPASPPVTGRAVDGYLARCPVFVDVDGDGLPGRDEPRATTDRLGGFAVPRTDSWRRGGLPAYVVVAAAGDPDCVDSFTLAAPGMSRLTSAEPVDPTEHDDGGVVMVTPLTTVAAAIAKRRGTTTGDAKAMVNDALGLDASIDVSRVDPVGAVADGDGHELVVATSLVANLVSALSALLTPACGGDAGQAETFVLNAVADLIHDAGTTGGDFRGRRRLLDGHVDLESTRTVSALANDSIEGAVAGGVVGDAINAISAEAVAAVAEVSVGSARVLRAAAADGAGLRDDPMAVVRSASAVAAVMQGPGVRGAIAEVAASGGGSNLANCPGFAALTELSSPGKMAAAVTVAELSLPAIEVARAPPMPPPPLMPPPPPLMPPPPPDERDSSVEVSSRTSAMYESSDVVPESKKAPSFGVVVGVVVGAVASVSCALAACRGRRTGREQRGAYRVDAKGRRVIGGGASASFIAFDVDRATQLAASGSPREGFARRG